MSLERTAIDERPPCTLRSPSTPSSPAARPAREEPRKAFAETPRMAGAPPPPMRPPPSAPPPREAPPNALRDPRRGNNKPPARLEQQVPPSAWKRPLPLFPPDRSAREKKVAIPVSRPPPPVAISIAPAAAVARVPNAAARAPLPGWLGFALGGGAVFFALGLALFFTRTMNAPAVPSAAAPPPTVAAWTLDDAPGVSALPLQAIPNANASAPPSTSSAPLEQAPPRAMKHANPAPSVGDQGAPQTSR